jgi:AmmeMemoRadiSam system protein B
MSQTIRYPAVAETFYPAEAHELKALILDLLAHGNNPAPGSRTVRAILAPHAAYSLSGEVAASAFKTIWGKQFNSVFMLGNTHAFQCDGIALDSRLEWHTPLGNIRVNQNISELLSASAPDQIHFLDNVHDADHVLEIHLPFLQLCLEEGFSIVPLLFGSNTDHDKAADILKSFLQPGDLLLVSTDLSHYPSYRQALTIDRESLDAIVNLDLEKIENSNGKLSRERHGKTFDLFCSPDVVVILILIARALGWKAELLSYANSGDSPHDDKTEVIGYGSVVFYEDTLL